MRGVGRFRVPAPRPGAGGSSRGRRRGVRRDGPVGPVPERLRLVVAGLRPRRLPRVRPLGAASGGGGPAACSARRGSDGVARHLHMGEQGLVEANAGFPHDSEVLQIPSRRADAFPCAQWGVCAHGSMTTYLDGDTETPRFRGKVGPASLRPRSPMCSSPPRPGIVGPDPVMRLPDGRRTVENLVLWSIDGTDEGCDRAVSGPTRPPTLRHSASPTFELDRSRRRRQRGLRGGAGGPAACHRPGVTHAGR